MHQPAPGKRPPFRASALVIATMLATACAGAIPPASSSSQPAATPMSSPTAVPSSTPRSVTATPTAPPAGEIVLAKSEVSRAPATPADAKAAADAINAFGFDLYGHVAEPGANTVFSPASIILALGMARTGAQGETAAEMDAVMHGAAAEGNEAWLNGLDRELAARTKSFEGFGERPQEVTLRIANTQFAQFGLALEPAYLDDLAARYDAGLNLVDYARDSEGARRAINGWVADQTEDRIPELLQPGDVNEQTILTLVNAIYLKAPWLYPFSKESTEQAKFALADGSRVEVPMMRLVSDGGRPTFHAAVTDEWQAIELAYVGGELSMLVVIPEDLVAFEGELGPERIALIDAALEESAVDLAFPRFGIETRAELAALLEALGMPQAFSAQADFSGIFGDFSVPIARVVHQANIDVDEIGTEAAAATAVGFDSSAGEPLVPLVIRADRPFLFLLRDVPTGAILFMGRVADPSSGR
jgi:serpin B